MLRKESRRRRTQSNIASDSQAPSLTSTQSATLRTPPTNTSTRKKTCTGKEKMVQKSQLTPSSCQNTPSTRDRQEWDVPVDASNENNPSTTSSPSAKQFRVLFYESASSSPVRTISNQRAVSSPITDDWREHTSRLDSDLLHGNLSMDSSLTSSSSLCDDNDASVPLTNSPPTTNRRILKSLLWQWSRSRSLLFCLTTLGIVFSSFTFLVSLSIRHPVELAASERVLRERFLPRHMRQRDGNSLLSLNTLAQGRPIEVKTVTLPIARATETKKHIQKGLNRTKQSHETPFTIADVTKPDNWNQIDSDQSFELHYYHNEIRKSSCKPRIAYLHDPQLSANHHAQRYV